MKFSKIFNIFLVCLTAFFLALPSYSMTKLDYYIYLKDGATDIHCDILSIEGDKALCRQSKTIMVYPYESIQKVKVLSDGKVFIFNEELKNDKKSLTNAFNVINSKKLIEHEKLAQKRRKILAQKRSEAAERRSEAAERRRYEGEIYQITQNHSQSNQPTQPSAAQQQKCQKLLDQLSGVDVSTGNTFVGIGKLKAKRRQIIEEYELRCMSGAERAERIKRRQNRSSKRQLNEIQRTQREIQDHQRGHGY